MLIVLINKLLISCINKLLGNFLRYKILNLHILQKFIIFHEHSVYC